MSRLGQWMTAVAALAVSACAGPEYLWVKAGVDDATFRSDRDACIAQVDRDFNPFYDYGPPHRGVSAAEEALHRDMAAQEMYNDCMRGRGYQLVEVPRKR